MRREQMHMMLDLLLDMGQRLVAMADAAINRMDEEPAAAPAGPASIKIEEE